MQKELLHKKAVRKIISLVVSGQFQEGKRLPAERKLCEMLGISRGTLRKALEELEELGVAKIRPKSGAYIQSFTYDKLPREVTSVDCKNVSLKDIFIARKAIELAALEQACERIAKKDLKILDKLIYSMQENIDSLPEYLSCDMKFHEQLVKASKNRVLITAFESICEYHKYSQVFTSDSESCEEDSLKYHKKILTAIKSGKSKLAAKKLRAHFDRMS